MHIYIFFREEEGFDDDCPSIPSNSLAGPASLIENGEELQATDFKLFKQRAMFPEVP